MVFSVKEMFYSLQGEGAQAGRPSLFIRFSGCNLWSGLERDRATAACNFCDTDFIGTDGQNGGKFPQATDLVQAAKALHSSYISLIDANNHKPYVIFTGGEPMLQVTSDLVRAFHQQGYEVGIETNGTLPVEPSIDWVCVSPKAHQPLKVLQGNELKVVYPQAVNPSEYTHLKFEHFYIQPKDGDHLKEYTSRAVDYCLHHPQWKLSIQTHKYLEID